MRFSLLTHATVEAPRLVDANTAPSSSFDAS